MNKLLIIGAGGHGKVVYDIAESTKRFDEICFLDDAVKGIFYKSRVVGTVDDINKYSNDYSFIVAIGNNKVRRSLQEVLKKQQAKIETLIHCSAVISSSVVIGQGTVVMPNVVVNADTKISEGCIVNTASIVEHDCNIGNFCHISPNVTICGTVSVGESTWVGAGATIINNISICSDVIVGAGSIVLKSIFHLGTYKGFVK